MAHCCPKSWFHSWPRSSAANPVLALAFNRNLLTLAQQRLRRVDVFGQFSELIQLYTFSRRLKGGQLHTCPTRRADLLKGVQCKNRGRRSIFPLADGFSYPKVLP